MFVQPNGSFFPNNSIPPVSIVSLMTPTGAEAPRPRYFTRPRRVMAKGRRIK